MRMLSYFSGLLVIGTFLVAMTPTSTAAAYCVDGVVNTYPHDNCDGLACLGQDQDGWMVCVPGVCPEMSCVSLELLCQFQSDCCYAVPGGGSFYCP